jgi:hypothetical protein
MNSQTDLQIRTRTAGQVVFVIGAVVAVALLILALPTQTVWTDRARTFAAQPRFWPAVALATMLIGFGVHLIRMKRRRTDRLDWIEARRWLEPIEYLVWFMAYVFAVPVLGFLPMSLAFAIALTYRLGYRSRLSLGLAALFALSMVVLFKGLLGVNIPGAAIYDYLPGALRSFALIYL